MGRDADWRVSVLKKLGDFHLGSQRARPHHPHGTRTRAMPMYDERTKRSTDVDIEALLNADVLVGAEPSKLRSHLDGEATIVLFVRNGA